MHASAHLGNSHLKAEIGHGLGRGVDERDDTNAHPRMRVVLGKIDHDAKTRFLIHHHRRHISWRGNERPASRTIPLVSRTRNNCVRGHVNQHKIGKLSPSNGKRSAHCPSPRDGWPGIGHRGNRMRHGHRRTCSWDMHCERILHCRTTTRNKRLLGGHHRWEGIGQARLGRGGRDERRRLQRDTDGGRRVCVCYKRRTARCGRSCGDGEQRHGNRGRHWHSWGRSSGRGISRSACGRQLSIHEALKPCSLPPSSERQEESDDCCHTYRACSARSQAHWLAPLVAAWVLRQELIGKSR
jgi:hypothetical protein